MRLYVICPVTRYRIYLENTVDHRFQLNPQLSLNCPYEPGIVHGYTNNEVIPEAEIGPLIGGGIAGGLVGLLGGPLGIILVGMAGAILGASSEEERVRRFG